IEKPNAPPACRGHGPASEQLAYEVFHPGAAVAQALQQSNVGKVREACGRSPRACRSQPHAAKAISQDQPQKIGRGLHSARPQKGTRFAGGGFDSCGPAELPQRCLPEFVQERFVSHAMLESDSIRAGKPYVSAYALQPGVVAPNSATPWRPILSATDAGIQPAASLGASKRLTKKSAPAPTARSAPEKMRPRIFSNGIYWPLRKARVSVMRVCLRFETFAKQSITIRAQFALALRVRTLANDRVQPYTDPISHAGILSRWAVRGPFWHPVMALPLTPA